MEITSCLKKYSDVYYEEMFGSSVSKNNHGFSHASKFLSDFALSTDEYLQECAPKMQKVFKPVGVAEFKICTSPVNMLFQPGYETTLLISSPLFMEDTYHLIQKICQACGDRFLYIVEDGAEDTAFQLKIPVTTSWEQLQSGGFISTVLFNMPYNNYRIFGDSCNWGRWCDYENSWADYEIFGSKLEIPEIKDYIKEMALSSDDYLYMQNNIGFPKNINIITGGILPDQTQKDGNREIIRKSQELSLYIK